MFPVTITLHDPSQLNAVMAALNSGASVAPATITKEPEIPAPAKQKANATTAPKQDTVDDKPWNSRADFKELPEYKAIGAAVIKVAGAKGREFAAALLEKTAGVKSLGESRPSQGAAIIAAFQEA
jgi:hypothetical protein